MAYSEELEQRIEDHLGAHPAVEPRKMFGGVAYMFQGNMAVGIHEDSLMVRLGADGHEDAMAQPGVSEFDMTGRPMKGWILVDAQVIANDDDLAGWIDQGIAFAGSLPPK